MVKIILFIIVFFQIHFAQQFQITGIVTDAATNEKLDGATITVSSGGGTISSQGGKFSISVLPGDSLSVSFVGYITKVIPIHSGGVSKILISLEKTSLPSQTILITGTRSEKTEQVTTFTIVNENEIKREYTLQDIPQFLSSLPSVISYSEGGNGIGYNYLSIRGFDQRRISILINGIPQNDPEDHGVYWIDFSDLLATTELIQVQRGTGGGIYGYPAIGGAINIVTSGFSSKPRISLQTAVGNNNTRKYSLSLQSGVVGSQYSFTAKLSQILSTGYKDLGWAKLSSFYLSGIRFDDNITTQVNIFGGPIEDGLTYTGVPKFAVKDKNLRRKNYSYWESDGQKITYATVRRPEEKENFSQPHFELLNEVKVNNNLKLNSTMFLILGNGFFDYDGSWANYSYFRLTPENGFNINGDPDTLYAGTTLIRAMVENKQFGWIPRIQYNYKGGELIAGAELRMHRSVHWGSVQYAEILPAGVSPEYRYYYYEGGKNIFGGFINDKRKITNKLSLQLEMQIMYLKYILKNERYVGNSFTVNHTFVNPRAGINLEINKEQSAYFSVAFVSKEPRLKNYYDAAESSYGTEPQFKVNLDGTYNYSEPLVKPEKMLGIELGYLLKPKNLDLSINAYYMLFRDEIVKQGQLDRFGVPVTGNVDASLHTGIETSAVIKLSNVMETNFNVTYSLNKITSGKTFITYPDPLNSGNTLTQAIDISGNAISGAPSITASWAFRYISQYADLILSANYVGDMYSDNYGKKLKSYLHSYPGFLDYSDNVNDAYLVFNSMINFRYPADNMGLSLEAFFQINNIFNSLYSAYAIGKEYFPAAERSFLAGLRIGF